MKRKMINATLFNVETENDEYTELRDRMITDLVADELDQPKKVLRALLEDYSYQMFYSMNDEALQAHYENLMESKEEPTIEEVVEEYAEELRAEGKDVETMIISPGDLDEI